MPNDKAVETGYSRCVFRDHTVPAPFVRQLWDPSILEVGLSARLLWPPR